MADVQRSAVGYAGEIRALEWIKWKYRLSDDLARAAGCRVIGARGLPPKVAKIP